MEIDHKVGVVLDQLEKDGLADNTIVLFFGDHGEANVRGKQFLYEEGLHIPLLIRWPKNFPMPAQMKPGKVDDRLIEAIDFAPTMLDLVGAKKPEKMQGRIFLGPNAEAPRDSVFGGRDLMDETLMHIRAVSDGHYRYLRNFTPEVPFLATNRYKEKQYPVWNMLKELGAQGKLTPAQAFLTRSHQPAEELYDLQSDPWEINNLAKDSQSATTLHQMRTLLKARLLEAGDRGHARLMDGPVVEAK
jgi:arylsulfatase A-like enzyme